MGHSAETIKLSLLWEDAGLQRREVVVRVRPEPPGLLEPYDLRMQFDLLRALAPTPVRSPTALWYEATGSMLGRECFVDGVRRRAPCTSVRSRPSSTDDPARVRRMSEALVDELVAIHRSTSPRSRSSPTASDPGRAPRLAHWKREMRSVQRGPLPALELLLAELNGATVHRPSDEITLVHGDAKPGNSRSSATA